MNLPAIKPFSDIQFGCRIHHKIYFPYLDKFETGHIDDPLGYVRTTQAVVPVLHGADHSGYIGIDARGCNAVG